MSTVKISKEEMYLRNLLGKPSHQLVAGIRRYLGHYDLGFNRRYQMRTAFYKLSSTDEQKIQSAFPGIYNLFAS